MRATSKIITSIILLSGCVAPRNIDGARLNPNGSKIKAVTIKQPELRARMDGPATDAEKDELFKNLKYKVSVKAQNCETGVTAETKEFEEKAVTDATVDSVFKVKKGCDYVFTMKYRDSKNDKIVLKSDGITVNLTKSDLEKANPTAKVKILATTDGARFWITEKPIETPSEPDVEISPQIGGTTSATMPDCMTKSFANIADGVKCLNLYSVYVLAKAESFNEKPWHAKFKQTMTANGALIAPETNDATANAKFCESLSRHRTSLATAHETICGGQGTVCLTDAETTFRATFDNELMRQVDDRRPELDAFAKCLTE